MALEEKLKQHARAHKALLQWLTSFFSAHFMQPLVFIWTDVILGAQFCSKQIHGDDH